jgi:predicted permease
VHLPRFAYGDTHRAELVDSLTRRLRDLPGVTAVTYIDGPPLGASGGTAFMIESRQVQAASYTIGPGYFAAMGTRILEGRDFNDQDISDARRVFIVNQAFARQHLNETAAGQRVRGWVRKGPEPWEIIAIVEDVRHRGLTEPPEPAVYLYRSAESRLAPTAPTFIIRTAGDAASFAPTLRSLVKQQDPTVIVDTVMTMQDRLLTSLAQPRLYAVLLGGFAGLALFIAAIGLFGVLSYTVAQRSRELAVRTALGARPADIVRLVLIQGLGVTAAGVAVGLPAAFLVTAAIGRLLYGVGQRDALTFGVAPIVILTVAALACVAPARRASRIDPLRALKSSP